MEDQRIQTIIEYLQRNEQYSHDQLRPQILEVGYTEEEFEQAVQQLEGNEVKEDLSPQGVTAFPFLTRKKIYIGLGILGLFAFGVGAFLTNERLKEEVPDETTSSASPTATPTQGSSFSEFLTPTLIPGLTEVPLTTPVDDPGPELNGIERFAIAIDNGFYRVTTSGVISGVSSHGTSSDPYELDLNEGLIYIKDGSVQSVQKRENRDLKTYLARNDGMYVLDPLRKVYSIGQINDNFGQQVLMTIQERFPLMSILNDTYLEGLVWEEIGENQWMTRWPWKFSTGTYGELIDTKVTIDPSTDLIITLSMRFSETEPWQDLTLQYEQLQTIDEFIQVPSDYIPLNPQ